MNDGLTPVHTSYIINFLFFILRTIRVELSVIRISGDYDHAHEATASEQFQGPYLTAGPGLRVLMRRTRVLHALTQSPRC